MQQVGAEGHIGTRRADQPESHQAVATRPDRTRIVSWRAASAPTAFSSHQPEHHAGRRRQHRVGLIEHLPRGHRDRALCLQLVQSLLGERPKLAEPR